MIDELEERGKTVETLSDSDVQAMKVRWVRQVLHGELAAAQTAEPDLSVELEQDFEMQAPVEESLEAAAEQEAARLLEELGGETATSLEQEGQSGAVEEDSWDAPDEDPRPPESSRHSQGAQESPTESQGVPGRPRKYQGATEGAGESQRVPGSAREPQELWLEPLEWTGEDMHTATGQEVLHTATGQEVVQTATGHGVTVASGSEVGAPDDQDLCPQESPRESQRAPGRSRDPQGVPGSAREYPTCQRVPEIPRGVPGRSGDPQGHDVQLCAAPFAV
jgi:hypothetical protein